MGELNVKNGPYLNFKVSCAVSRFSICCGGFVLVLAILAHWIVKSGVEFGPAVRELIADFGAGPLRSTKIPAPNWWW